MFSAYENSLKSAAEKLLLSAFLLLTIFGPRELRCVAAELDLDLPDASKSGLSPAFVFKRLGKGLFTHKGVVTRNVCVRVCVFL